MGHVHAPETADDQFGASVEVEHRGSAVVLHVAGELDLLTTPTVAGACARVDATPTGAGDRPDRRHLLASVGMSALVAAHEEGGAHTKVRVVSGNRDTLRPLRVTGLDSLLAVYPALRDV
jgi:anti-sigma B factor antagonist